MSSSSPDPRIFSIAHGERSYCDTEYHLKSHTLHVRQWGLEVVSDSGQITGYPWTNVRSYTLGWIE